MKRVQILTIVSLFVLSTYGGGCGDKFFDPIQIGRFRPVPAVNVILDSLGVADETASAWEGAEAPKPVDVIIYETDYVFGPGDIIRISIFELLQEGVASISDYTVTETGKISIPDVGIVEVAGLTEAELEEQIAQILSPNILKEPSVTVTLMSSQKRTYSILGYAVPAPGRYGIPRYDFRLNDALATGQVATQFNVSYIYVSRAVTGKEAITELIEPGAIEELEPEKPVVPEEEMMEIIAPRAKRLLPEAGLIITSSEMVTDEELAEMALPEGFEQPANAHRDGTVDEETIVSTPREAARETIAESINEADESRIEWIFQDGKWVPIQIGQPKLAEPTAKVELEKETGPLRQRLPEAFDWEQIETGGAQTRVIEIPTDKLAGGDPRYNIVIRPGDTIHVPVDVIGEYFIYGNTNFQGAVPLTGRPLTLKMAIAAAGGLGPLAWPKRCEVTRRIAKDKEETVMVDLDKIASGEQPDFFIKPLDLINVGTHPTARWRAVLRNAFRATYGFGFIYDRNFADRDYGTSRPVPSFISKLF
ncbi:MAG: polysaccharide biosynthesis/export family protein [Planctomycetota bacterium]|jgi:polysaccharide export outer membrane protein